MKSKPGINSDKFIYSQTKERTTLAKELTTFDKRNDDV